MPFICICNVILYVISLLLIILLIRGVTSQVFGQVARLSKALFTVMALKRSLSSMCSDMNLKVA